MNFIVGFSIRALHFSAQMTLVLYSLAFFEAYHFLSPRYSTPNERSRILTTTTCATMGFLFLWDYFHGGKSVQDIQPFVALANVANRGFQAFLVVHLIVLGIMYYRGQGSFLNTWVHHSLYIVVVQLARRRSWGHIFCLCASMELSTLILGNTQLYPQVRPRFLSVISFLMRLTLHANLCTSSFLRDDRAHARGSFVSSSTLTFIFLLYILWFHQSTKRYIKSRTPMHIFPPVIGLDVRCVTKSPVPARHSPIPGAMTSKFDPTLPNPEAQLRIWRASFENKARRMQLECPKSRAQTAATRWRAKDSRGFLPDFEVVFDFVGLGRTRPLESGLKAKNSAHLFYI